MCKDLEISNSYVKVQKSLIFKSKTDYNGAKTVFSCCVNCCI